MRLRALKGLGVAVAALALVPFDAEAASLSGQVQIDGKRRLRNLVVYLEPVGQASGQAAVKSARVSQRGRAFSPRTTVVVQGGQVDFVNDEEQDIDHNVFSLSGKNKFDIGLAAKGATDKVIFKNPGIVKYFCSVHKNMQGTIVVVPSPYFAILKKPGSFKIDDVPSGDWVVKVSVSHRRFRSKSVKVTVAGAAVNDVVVQLVRKK